MSPTSVETTGIPHAIDSKLDIHVTSKIDILIVTNTILLYAQ